MTILQSSYVIRSGLYLGCLSSLVILMSLFPPLSLPLAAGESTPNDPFYHDQVSFYHPGGHVSANTRSYKAALKDFDIRPGITLDIERAWNITTGSSSIVVALLDDEIDLELSDEKQPEGLSEPSPG